MKDPIFQSLISHLLDEEAKRLSYSALLKDPLLCQALNNSSSFSSRSDIPKLSVDTNGSCASYENSQPCEKRTKCEDGNIGADGLIPCDTFAEGTEVKYCQLNLMYSLDEKEVVVMVTN